MEEQLKRMRGPEKPSSVASGDRARAAVWDAAARALRAEQANFTLLVDAKDETAVAFYRHFGFVPLITAPRILFLPLATVAHVIEQLATRGA